MNSDKKAKNLLEQGRSYTEVSAETGLSIPQLYRRRWSWGIDLQSAFANRMRRDGYPDRSPDDPVFRSWFVGFFDGEGSLVLSRRVRSNGLAEYMTHLSISLRDDDAAVLQLIHHNLGGTLNPHTPANGSTNPVLKWRIEAIADLVEVVFPIFDEVPLKSKKGREYLIWRGIVLDKYHNTLGGTTRFRYSDSFVSSFTVAEGLLHEIREYQSCA